MNRVICVNGHFYDGDIYDKCPHCAAGVPPVKQDPFAVRQDSAVGEKEGEKPGVKQEPRKSSERKRFFGRKNRQEERSLPAEEEKTAVLGEAFQQIHLDSAEDGGQEIPTHSEQNGFGQSEQNVFPKTESGGVPESRPNSQQNSVSVRGGRKDSSLSREFAAVKGNEPDDEGKTVGFFATGRNVEPPVGYLICTAGEDFGNGFPLKSGNNSLGRSASMDVVIMDEKVSRQRQAIVMYEPRRREFYLRPGDSSGLCYLEGEVVLESVKLKAFDRIMLGDTELMLFPVCCDRFSWDDMEKNKG